MDQKRKPGRPASDDPKVAVSLRLRRSVVAAWQADGGNWRAQMERALEEALAAKPEQTPQPRAQKAKPAVKAAAAAPAANPERLSVSLPFGGDVRRGPIQKTGKRQAP